MIRDIALDHADDPALRRHLRPYQIRILERIGTCGTPAAGMHREACDACGDVRLRPNTCGSRSCPHCQGRARADWVDDRMAELLPCGYFHVVLTLPPVLRDLAMAFPRIVLGALMTAAGDAIDYLCRKPAFLGATVGQLAILHTWRRDLGIHPHVHVLATDGGWDARRQTWVDARRYGPADTPFLLPVDVLLAAFQRRLRRLLLRAYARGDFADGPHEAFPMLATTATFTGVLNRMCATRGVARIEPPFGGPAQLLKYLGAYVNRVAIGPRRVTAYDPATGLSPTPGRPTLPPMSPAPRPSRRRTSWCASPSTSCRPASSASASAGCGALHIGRPSCASPSSGSLPTGPPHRLRPRRLNLRSGLGRWRLVPGTWQRPTAAERRRLLEQLRQLRRTQTPVEATIPA